MLYYSVNGEKCTLPLAELYKDRFAAYTNGDVVCFDSIEEEEKYKQVDELFGFVAKSFVVTLGEMQDSIPGFRYAAEVQKIRERIASVDRLQRFFHEDGHTVKSIEMMEKFVFEMCQLAEKVDKEEKQELEATMGR